MNKKLVSLVAAVFMFATNAGAVDFSGKTCSSLFPMFIVKVIVVIFFLADVYS